MRRRRRGRRGRFPIQPRIGARPKASVMTPEPKAADVPIQLDLAEIEVLRLIDLEGMYQEEAGEAMGFSRGTVWRLLQDAREKVVRAIFEGRPLVIGEPEQERT
ncbi:MAG: DUF134 domain-containing protein [Candidatus Hermodarchaeota archaeon]